MVSRFFSPFFDSSFQLCFSFFLLVDVSKNKNVLFVVKCGKNSPLFKNIFERQNPFYFPLFLKVLLTIFLSS